MEAKNIIKKKRIITRFKMIFLPDNYIYDHNI